MMSLKRWWFVTEVSKWQFNFDEYNQQILQPFQSSGITDRQNKRDA